jgi:cytochrome c peroxidase
MHSSKRSGNEWCAPAVARHCRAHRLASILTCFAAVLLLALAGVAGARPMSRQEARRQAQALAALGRALFADPRLSASGRLACASCHSPDHAFGPPNALAVQIGGSDMRQPGRRAVPSLRYLQSVPQFTEHLFESDDEADESIDNGPSGGLTWDGRVDTAHAQARIPLLSPIEMGNGSPDEVVSRALAAGYGPTLATICGSGVPGDREALFRALLEAFEAYEQDWRSFYPYSSKYDFYLAGRATRTRREARGLRLFEDPAKGNCASCHVSKRAADGTPPQFTDYGMVALGVPRNPEIPANADPAYYDLGLCGPLRTDFRRRAAYCGLFRTPSLRNVATRRVFFHNGAMHSLRDAVAFYATRDTDPDRWYPKRPDGSIASYDDLPRPYRTNLHKGPPFGGKPGGKAALNDEEIDAIVTFLQTLTDGWQPDSRNRGRRGAADPAPSPGFMAAIKPGRSTHAYLQDRRDGR